MTIKICLSGGSCGGKSTVLSLLGRFFAENHPEYQLFTVSETPTEVMAMGIDRTLVSNYRIEEIMLELQLQKEQAVLSVADSMPNSVVIYDRGLLDLMAYLDRPSYERMIRAHGIPSIQAAAARYDAIIHLVSAAVGTNDYNMDNPCRIENAEQAVLAEHQTRLANLHHPRLSVVDNSTGFEQKITRTFSEIEGILADLG